MKEFVTWNLIDETIIDTILPSIERAKQMELA